MELKKRILVTGGAGLIGSHLCRRLTDYGHEVYCMDIRSRESSPLLSQISAQPNFNYIRHNVVNPFGINVDEIYHLASPSTLRYESGSDVETLKTNILGTINCLENAKIHRSRILLASSGDVYGSSRQQSLREEAPYGPALSSVTEAKRAAESLMRAYKAEYQVDGKIARIFNTYGSGADTCDRRVVAKMTVEALTGRNITIYGSGEQLRCFCWVEDLVEALIRLMNIPDTEPTATVNLGSSVEISINRLADMIVTLTGSRSRIVHIPARSDDPRRMAPDLTRARNMLDWRASTSIEDGLRMTIGHVQSVLHSLTRDNAAEWIETL